MGGSKRKRQRMSRSATWLITVTVLIVAFLSLKMVSLMKTEREYASKEREAVKAYEAESQKSIALEESAAYIKSSKFVEDEAMAKLHLGYPETTAPETEMQNVEEGQADAGAQPEAGAQPDDGAAGQADAEGQAEAGAQPEAGADGQVEAGAADQSGSGAQAETNAQPDAGVVGQVDTGAQSGADAQSDMGATGQADVGAQADTVTQMGAGAQVSSGTPAGVGAQAAAGLPASAAFQTDTVGQSGQPAQGAGQIDG